MASLFLDANVFLYAIGADRPYRESCRALLQAVGDGVIAGVTSSEVLQEVLHVRARRVGVKDATRALRAAAKIPGEVLPVTREDLLEACVLLDTHPELRVRDALHAAVMKRARLSLLVSVDRHFDALKSLRRLSPEEALSLSC